MYLGLGIMFLTEFGIIDFIGLIISNLARVILLFIIGDLVL